MTIQEALDLCDGMKPNMMQRQVKIKHLETLERMIWAEIIMTHEPEGRRRRMPVRFLQEIKAQLDIKLAATEATAEELRAFCGRIGAEIHKFILFNQHKMPPKIFEMMQDLEADFAAEAAAEAEKAEIVAWLTQMSGEISQKCAETDEPKYTGDSDPGTELLIPDPYSMVYVYWLMKQIDLMNQEMDMYNNDNALFEQAYNTMHDWYNRTRIPVQRHREIRI